MEQKSPYQISRCETLAQLDALEKEWADLLVNISEAPIFLSWEWIRTWWLYFGQDRQLWLLTARNQQGRLLGIAPLMKEQRIAGLLKLRVFTFIGADLTNSIHLDFLIHPLVRGELIDAFLEFLLNQSEEWDVLSLESVAEESDLYDLIGLFDRHVKIGNKKTSAYISLPDSWEVYTKTLSKKLRRNLKYFRSKLDHDYPGHVAFSRVTDLQEMAAIMQKLEELNKDRWHSKKRVSNFDHQGYSSFHLTMAHLGIQCDWLRLYQLTVSGNVIAICYNYLFHDRIYANAIAFDMDWSSYSPGRLAISYSIQAAIQEGATEYDWLGGEEPYKLAWTDKLRVEDEIIFSKTWHGRLWLEWRSFSECFKEVLIALGRKWVPESARERINQFLSPRYKKKEA